MTDPINSEYDTDPLEPPDDDSSDDSSEPAFPDKGKDFSGKVPTLHTAWDKLPSFNDPPPGDEQKPSEGKPPAIPEGSSVLFRASQVRDTEQAMLTSTRTAVDEYETLRKKVLAEKDDVFGQGLRHEYESGTVNTSGGAGLNNPQEHNDDPATFNGDEFGATMVPMMEKTLREIGSVLSGTGEYIAMINIAGQTYGKADTESKFPSPPGH